MSAPGRGDHRSTPPAEPGAAADAALRTRVREALAAEEPAEHPAFADVYAAARRRNASAADARTPKRRFAMRYGPAGAFAAALALTVLLVRPWESGSERPAFARDAAPAVPGAATGRSENAGAADAAARADAGLAARDPDYAAALSLRRSMRVGTPLDPLLASLPRTVARGLPDVPAYRYPLLPEGAPFGASAPPRNPS